MLVAGVDGYDTKWMVALGEAGGCARDARLAVADDFSGVLRLTEGCAAVCLDMPVGLPGGDQARECDALARARLAELGAGLRGVGSRVFSVAPRHAVQAGLGYRETVDLCRRLTGKGLSRQAFALFTAMRQVDDLMTPGLQRRVVETHPELSFARLAGRTLDSKHTALGALQRAAALGLDAGVLGAMLARCGAGAAASGDALDALACLDAAAHVARANVDAPDARRLPGERMPPRDERGLRMEIWF